MRTMLLLLTALTLAGNGFAQSQVPPPTPGISSDGPQPQATNEDKNPASNQSGSGQTPPVIKTDDPNQAKNKPAGIPREGNQQTTPEWWLSAWWPSSEGWLAIWTLGLFGATVILACATFRLVRDAKDTAERQLRAYVSLHISSRNYPSIHPNRHAVSLFVTNGGKTWARKLRIKMGIISQEDCAGRDPFDLLPQDEKSPLVLGPGQVLELQFGDIQRTEVPNIVNGTIGRYFVALATYEDTMSQSKVIRQTHLSCRLNGDQEGGISFGYLPTHNCADDDCP